jgi:hypothetical protein
MEYELLLVTVLGTVVVYLVWDTYFTGNLQNVKSSYDGKIYTVQSMPDKEDAADLLAHIGENLTTLVGHLEKIYPDDPRTQKVSKNFNADRISEGVERENYTSYSVNKGERIVFCLRSKDKSKNLVDLNTMMFVALHEIAHIATESVGHTDEFWSNFKWLLQESIQIGIYTKQDFKEKPKKYCGINIESSPLDN